MARKWSVTIKGIFEDNVLSGTAMDWDILGCKERMTTYRAGLADGVQQEWYKNGNLKMQCSYRRGLLDGLKTVWHSDGKINSQLSYLNGLLHGIRRTWDESGKCTGERIYIRGVLTNSEIQNFIHSIKTRKFQAKDIIKIRNIAARRICLEEFGYERFMAQLEHTILDVDGKNELVRIDWHKDEEPVFLVKVKCPSTGAFYALRVPPHMKKVKQAIAWTFHFKKDEYQPEREV